MLLSRMRHARACACAPPPAGGAVAGLLVARRSTASGLQHEQTGPAAAASQQPATPQMHIHACMSGFTHACGQCAGPVCSLWWTRSHMLVCRGQGRAGVGSHGGRPHGTQKRPRAHACQHARTIPYRYSTHTYMVAKVTAGSARAGACMCAGGRVCVAHTEAHPHAVDCAGGKHK